VPKKVSRNSTGRQYRAREAYKGKPLAKVGRKATGLMESAGLPPQMIFAARGAQRQWTTGFLAGKPGRQEERPPAAK